MKLKPWHQRVLLGATAVAAFLAAVSDEGQQVETAQVHAAVPRVAEAPPPQPALRVELERLERTRPAPKQLAVGTAFSATSWFVPPPPQPARPVVKAPPPPPSAPAMPFSFLGRYVEDGTLVILLVKGDRIYTVAEGEVIDNTYRVERLANGSLEMTYLPLNIRQTLQAGES